jgi:hypothetical protein
MSFIDFLKEIFTTPDAAFKKLFVSNYFLSQRAKMNTEEYARWLNKQYAEYCAMAYIRKYKGLSVSSSWIDGLKLIEIEIEKINTQGTSHLFSPNMEKASDDFK